jgi:hypothetical protein
LVCHIGDFEERYSVDIFGGHICDTSFQLGVFISWNFKTRTKKTFVLHMMIFSRLLKGLTQVVFAEFTPRHPAVEHF